MVDSDEVVGVILIIVVVVVVVMDPTVHEEGEDGTLSIPEEGEVVVEDEDEDTLVRN